MPVYRFQIQSHLTTQAVLERVRALLRETPAFQQSLKESFGSRSDGAPPFIGKVEGSKFKCRRDIRYQNSFLPRIAGHVDSYPTGTKIDVIMYLHPLVLVFMLFWLGGVGVDAAAALRQGDAGAWTLVPMGMFVFGVALTLGGFYPEAIKARRLLEQHIGPTTA
jgi:hypothetical protein